MTRLQIETLARPELTLSAGEAGRITGRGPCYSSYGFFSVYPAPVYRPVIYPVYPTLPTYPTVIYSAPVYGGYGYW